ncbi:MAG: hypothetical protein ACRDLL_04390 [Solirubrobacterales bacterium]
MPDDIEVSAALGTALAEEWRALTSRVEEQRERADRLRALADQVEEQARRDAVLLAELQGLAGIAPQLRIETLDEELRGRRLREVAIEILEADVGRGEPIHYKEWFQRLRDRGHRVSGRDPLANFLAQISRDPDIERVGSRTGLYRLRAA